MDTAGCTATNTTKLSRSSIYDTSMKCNSSSIARYYESRTQNIVENIQNQISELVNKVDIQINQLNNTISSTNSEIEHLLYLSHFSINTSNLRSFFIDSKNNLIAMHKYLNGIDESLNNFSFYQFQGYSKVFVDRENFK